MRLRKHFLLGQQKCARRPSLENSNSHMAVLDQGSSSPEQKKEPGNAWFFLLVRERGLEPPHLAALVPETSASTIPPLARG